jgi:hypothetical protein
MGQGTPQAVRWVSSFQECATPHPPLPAKIIDRDQQ